MCKRRLIWLAAIWIVAGAMDCVRAQSGFTSGFYRIVSGQYVECCGIAGPFTNPLPDPNQTFIELIVAPDGKSAQMTFLGQDQQTVFKSYAWGGGGGFSFSFSNGIVFPDRIQFGDPLPFPFPDQLAWSYSVSNSADGLRIEGMVVTPPVGADIPNQFEHTNVVARLEPGTTVIDQIKREGDLLSFHFIGQPPNRFTVEFTDALPATNWFPLAAYLAKIQTIDVVVTNSVTNAQAQFFRVRQEPCNCR